MEAATSGLPTPAHGSPGHREVALRITSVEPGPGNALTDVAGIRVGHHTAIGDGYLTGTTVVAAPDGGMVAGVDVRGGSPGTHETDLLHPSAAAERIDAVVLTGGSAFGLAACVGAMEVLADRGLGVSVGLTNVVVPLIPGAVIFDLGRGGDPACRPDAAFGRAATLAALAEPTPGPVPSVSTVGAGTGAVTANLKGGLGQASAVLPGGATVAALVVVNAAGSPVDPRTGELLGARYLLPADTPALPVPTAEAASELTAVASHRPEPPDQPAPGEMPGRRLGGNTTLAVIATDVVLDKARCGRLAATAHNGLARALNPVHLMVDGDVVFGVSTMTRPAGWSQQDSAAPGFAELDMLLAAAADVLTRAVTRAIVHAETTSTPGGQWPSWRSIVDTAGGRGVPGNLNPR